MSTALTKGKHAGDFRYLEEIAQSWCEGWQVERTKSEQVEEVKINLLHPSSGTELSLEFADLSGETFEKAFETRLCRQTFVDLVKNAAGLLLFVSAIRQLDDVTILDAFAGEEADQMTLEEDQGDTTPWNPTKTPLQVQIVDLLQALRLAPFSRRPFKVAVIVSAWDLSSETSADDWLAKKMPLLDQYLRNGSTLRRSASTVFPPKAASYRKRARSRGLIRDRLLALDRPSERIKIVGMEVREHDLTGPLLWLSGLDKKT